jgi:hypothetical protein
VTGSRAGGIAVVPMSETGGRHEVQVRNADAGVDHTSSRIGKFARERANCTSRMHAAIKASRTASYVAER